MELITPPSAILARRLIARHEPSAAIGGHADAVEEVLVEVFKVRFPGLSRAIHSQFDFEDRGTLRLQGDQDRDTNGKDFITEIKHQLLGRHRQGRGQQTARALEPGTEIAQRVGLVAQML